MPIAEKLSSARELVATNTAHFPNESAAYRTARNALLLEEIELRRHIERVAAQRRALPVGGEVPRDLELLSETGPIRFSSLFGNKDTLLVYSMMYGPERKAPCPDVHVVFDLLEWHCNQSPRAMCNCRYGALAYRAAGGI